MLENIDLLARENDGLIVQRLFKPVMGHDDVVDECTGVSTRKHEAHFANNPVDDVLTALHQVVGVDGERRYILVQNERLGILTIGGLIELAVGVDAIRTILENCMPENVVDVGVTVLPAERNLLTIVTLEGVGLNSPPIAALHVGTRSVTAEVEFHSYPFLGCL